MLKREIVLSKDDIDLRRIIETILNFSFLGIPSRRSFTFFHELPNIVTRILQSFKNEEEKEEEYESIIHDFHNVLEELSYLKKFINNNNFAYFSEYEIVEAIDAIKNCMKNFYFLKSDSFMPMHLVEAILKYNNLIARLVYIKSYLDSKEKISNNLKPKFEVFFLSIHKPESSSFSGAELKDIIIFTESFINLVFKDYSEIFDISIDTGSPDFEFSLELRDQYKADLKFSGINSLLKTIFNHVENENVKNYIKDNKQLISMLEKAENKEIKKLMKNKQFYTDEELKENYHEITKRYQTLKSHNFQILIDNVNDSFPKLLEQKTHLIEE